MKGVSMEDLLKAASSNVDLSNDYRTEKPKEFFKKLKVKSNSNETDKRHLNLKSKEDKEAEMRRRRKSLIFKAKLMPDFYRVQGKSKNPLEKDEKIVIQRQAISRR